KPARKSQLWSNLHHLKRSFGLNTTELDVIAFRAMLRLHPGFAELAGKYIGQCIDFQFRRRLAAIFAVPPSKVERAFDPEGRLLQSGLVSIDLGVLGPIETRLRLSARLISSLVQPNRSAGDLLASLLPRMRKPHLCLDDYPHLHDEVRLLRDSLCKALSGKRRGANVLLHGAPGTGKSELAAALAAELNCPLYESRISDGGGESLTPRNRLGSAVYLQRIITVAGNGILLVDEAEDLFPTVGSDLEKVATKAAVNECLESNPTPTIWISNRVRHLDEAFLRRFDLVIHVSSLPARAKGELLRKALPSQALGEREIRQYADLRELSPAMLTRLASIAVGDGASANTDVRRNLQILSSHYMKTLGSTPPSFSSRAPALKHDLALLNTDVPLKSVIDTMARSVDGARMLLHGLPGTGKTAFGKAVAERLNRPLLQRQASSLLSMWLGGTERNLREMFDEARQEDGVLLLDEADSFLRDRSNARAHWEATQTNELLTQMEAFEGIFICTTNRLDDLDPAALRRFDLKVEFRPLRDTQRLALLHQSCASLGISVGLDEPALSARMQQLDGLTPGDAAAALRRLAISGEPPTVDSLINALATECRYKAAIHQPIGFVH
ncbi:MAG: ATP-binding protein, partial [Rhodanobacter sp.]